jgi:hypothetical protein
MLGEAFSSSAATRPNADPSTPLATKRYRKLKVIEMVLQTVKLGSSPSSCTPCLITCDNYTSTKILPD